jgi:hypothetical protein
LRRDDRLWSRPRCGSLGFQQSFDIKLERVALKMASSSSAIFKSRVAGSR